MSTLRARTITEVQLRAAALPREIERFKADAAANAAGFGIHKTQVDALKILMDGLIARQRSILGQLTPALSPADFADGMSLLLTEVAAAQDVWRLFSLALAQRRLPDVAARLDAADLVAADCYKGSVVRALRNWNLVDDTTMREPPLVCLDAEQAPIAVGRQDTLADLGHPLHRYVSLRLPIPILLLPADHTECFWLLSTLHHEVGHIVDQDLKLSTELKGKLLTATDGKVPSDRQTVWFGWTAEILADAFGVILGSAGFAHALGSLLLILAPSKALADLDTTAKHPHPFIRLPLVCAMLRKLGVPSLSTAADSLMSDHAAMTAPKWLPPFLGDIDLLADTFLGTKLTALGDHTIAEINPLIATDVAQAEALAGFLTSGIARPSPATFPYRLVPVAAQLAVAGAAAPTEQLLASVQKSAMDFLDAIPRPPMLAGPGVLSAGRRASYAQMVKDMDFASTGGF